jgi:hypothetical protein
MHLVHLQYVDLLLLLACIAANDPPTFTSGLATVPVLEDSGAYNATWATSVSAGPGETSQTVAFSLVCSNSALFSAAPQLSAAGQLTFTPAANAFGSSVCNATLTDSAGASAAPQLFTIVISAGKEQNLLL